MGGVHCAVGNYINSMADLQTTMDNCQNTILAAVRRLVEYQSSCLPDGDSLHTHNGPWYAPDDPTLPQPWKGLVDGSSGSIYYWNTETNITQYEKPNPVFFLPTDHYSCVSAPPVPNTNYHHNSSLTHPIIPYPSQHGLPFTTSAYPSESDYGYLSSPYPWNQPFPCEPYSTSPHNSFYSPITHPHIEPKEPIIPPYQLPYAADLISPSALASIAGGTSCTEKDDVPPLKMKKSLCRNLKMRSHVMMKRKPRSQFPRRRRAQNNGSSEGDLCKASSRMAANWDSTVLSDKSVNSLSQLTVLDLVVKKGSISVASKNAPLFFPGDKTKPFLSVEAVYGQMLGPDEFCKTGRAKDLLRLANFQRIKDNSGGPLVNGELKSIDMELARFFFNLSLEKPIMNSGHILADDKQHAIVNHFCNLVVGVDHFSLVTNFLSGLNLILLSMSFVESPVTLEVSLPQSNQHGIKHKAVAFDKCLVCSFIFMALTETVRVAHFCYTLPNWKARAKNVLASSKEGFEYNVHLENLIESLTRNSQRFFIKMDGRRIESNCSVFYHWLPSSLNWDKEFLRDAFSSHEFSVSFMTLKFLPPEFCKSGSKFLKKEMVEASLENTGLKVMIDTRWKVMNYVLHLVGTLVIVFVGHTISIALVDNQNLGGGLIILEVQLGLLIVVVLPFVAVNQLLVIGITSDGLVIVPIADSCNKKLLVCSLITAAASKKIWGQFISLKNHNLDVQLNFLVQCIFRIEYQHMDISCILHSCGKHLNQSHFLVQFQKNSGIIFFAILEQLKQTYGVMCFVSLIEGYLVNYLLSGEANMSAHWWNKSSKFGECRVHELLQCKYKMKISPKLDDTSWKLVVIQIVKVALKENANFYHYVKWAVSLVILHLGCQSFFFLYDGIGHFQTDAENLTIINGGAKDGNMLSCKVATEVSIGNVLGPPEIYVAWKKTTFLHVFYITLLPSILDVDLDDILNTLASANDIALQNTTWKVILIFRAIHSQAFSMSLFEMAPKQFYTATVAAKVRQCALTMLNMISAIFSLAEIELGLHYLSLNQADNCLKINSMVVLFRYHSGTHLTMVTSTVILALVLNFLALTPYYTAPGMINLFETTLTHSRDYWLNWEVMPHAPWDFILMLIVSLIVGQRVVQVLYWQLYVDGAGQRHSLILGPPLYKIANFSGSNTFAMHLLAFVVIFGGIDAANSIGILQTCQEEYHVQSYRKEVNAHILLIMNPSDVVLKKSMLTLSTFNSCGYWNAKKAAKAKAQMQDEGIQTTVNLCTKDLSNVAGQTKAIWLQLKGIGFNSPPTTILRHEDTPFFKGGGMIGSLGYGPTLIKWAACLIGSITVIEIKA